MRGQSAEAETYAAIARADERATEPTPHLGKLLSFQAFLALNVSRWFLVMFLLPLVVYRGLFVFAFDIIVLGGKRVEVLVDDVGLELLSGRAFDRSGGRRSAACARA